MDVVGLSATDIRPGGGCDFLTPQEQLSPNITESLPFPNMLVIDATDVQNLIMGELILIRAVNLSPSNFHTEGFYDYDVLGRQVRRKFSLAVNLEQNHPN
jgi:hypothetical protein